MERLSSHKRGEFAGRIEFGDRDCEALNRLRAIALVTFMAVGFIKGSQGR